MSKDIESFNDKGQPHGLRERYYLNGQLMYKGFYQNDKLVGYEECFYYNGDVYRKNYNL
jgi:antitoxin component YwqK of YwqJK toxin-antitoxin module